MKKRRKPELRLRASSCSRGTRRQQAETTEGIAPEELMTTTDALHGTSLPYQEGKAIHRLPLIVLGVVPVLIHRAPRAAKIYP